MTKVSKFYIAQVKQVPLFSELEPFLTLSSFTTFDFYKSKADYYYNFNLAIENQSFNTVLLQQTILNKLPYLVDAYTLSTNSHSVFYIFNCFYTNKYVNFCFNITHTHLTSISPLFRGAVWVERELKEFSTLYIKSLLDSRRLLTDYTILKTKDTPLFYDLVTQEVF